MEKKAPEKRPRVLKASVQRAARVLCGEEKLITLVIAYLFCILVAFAVSFCVMALAFFWSPVTPLGALALFLLRIMIALVAACVVLLPLFVGYMRMAGMVAAGFLPEKKELFHYFCTPRLWWRGVRIGLLWPLGVLLPCFFSICIFL
jgi:hypothetical protein